MGSRKQGEESNRLVLGVIKAHGTISTAQIAKILGRPAVTIRDVCRRLQSKGYIVPTEQRATWKLSDTPVPEGTVLRTVRSKPEPDTWTPQPWVHPIRQRFLAGR